MFARCYPVFPLMCSLLLFPHCYRCSTVCT